MTNHDEDQLCMMMTNHCHDQPLGGPNMMTTNHGNHLLHNDHHHHVSTLRWPPQWPSPLQPPTTTMITIKSRPLQQAHDHYDHNYYIHQYTVYVYHAHNCNYVQWSWTAPELPTLWLPPSPPHLTTTTTTTTTMMITMTTRTVTTTTTNDHFYHHYSYHHKTRELLFYFKKTRPLLFVKQFNRNCYFLN